MIQINLLLPLVVICALLWSSIECSPNPQSLGAALAGKPVTVVKDDEQYVDGKGNYKYDIELSDGTKLQQEGMTEPPESGEEGALHVTGGYQYVAPDGATINVTYVADKDGFRPISKRIPKTN